MEVIITRGQTEDIEAIAQFQVDMSMESEGTVLDRDTATQGVSAAIHDENKGIYYVGGVNGKAVASLMLTREWSDWNNG